MKHLLLVLLFVNSLSLIAQCPPPSIFNFTTQAQIDSFPILFPNCTELDHPLPNMLYVPTINIGSTQNPNSDISDLTPLSQITAIDNQIIDIRNCPNLTSLNGIESITDIRGLYCRSTGITNLDYYPEINNDGIISFRNNNALLSLNGINETFNGSFTIVSTGDLDISATNNWTGDMDEIIIRENTINNYDGLNNIVGVDKIFMDGNTGVYSNSMFQSLVSVQSKLEIEDNGFNGSISNFNNLVHVPQKLSIKDNDNIISIDGFNAVTKLEILDISINKKLTEITGFNELDSVGNFRLRHNKLLTDLPGFNDDLVIYDKLVISSNIELSYCRYYPICNALDDNTITKQISNNNTGCNSEQEVANSCLTVGETEYQKLEGLRVQPNPVSTYLNIDLEVDYNQVSVFDIHGRLIKSVSNMVSGEPVSVEDISNGVYFLRINTLNGIYQTKFVKI